MKTLERLTKALPLALCLNFASCTFLNNLFNPEVPDKIDGNTENTLSSTLVCNPSSGYAPLDVNINYSEIENKAIQYTVAIDEGNDGVIDEEIIQSTPINVDRTFESGESIIYAQCKDGEGKTDNKSMIISVYEPEDPENPNHAPKMNLGVTPASGVVPLSAEIFAQGSDEDGDEIQGIELRFDFEQDGIIDEELTFQGNQKTLNKIFEIPNDIRVYARCKDSKGAYSFWETKDIKTLNRGDLDLQILLEPNYVVGNKFKFTGIIQNATDEDLEIDNYSKKGSLVYRVVNATNKKAMFEENLESHDFIVQFYERGKIKMEYGFIDEEGKEKIKYTIENSHVNYDGEDWNIEPNLFPNGLAIRVDNEGEILTQSGNYYLETVINYLLNGKEYYAKLKSPIFPIQ